MNTSMNLSLVVDEARAAKMLDISKRTLQRLRDSGGGPPFIRIGRRVLYRTASLQEWLAAKELPHNAAQALSENTPPRAA